MNFENTEVFNFEGAIRGMRNPKESWKLSDSEDCVNDGVLGCEQCKFYNKVVCPDIIIGAKDMELMQKLIKAGSTHRKFLRQIFVSVDITAPLYWWKEFDTYKVGTAANSTSTMHKLASTPITIDCFEMGDYSDFDFIEVDNKVMGSYKLIWNQLISYLELLRMKYNETEDKRYWKELIRLLPESWLQKRTVTMNYENILSMIRQRKSHKLTEWSVSFIEWVKSLPYAEQLILI